MSKHHPLHPTRAMTDSLLRELAEKFNALYADSGQDSILSEKLRRAQLLMALHTVDS